MAWKWSGQRKGSKHFRQRQRPTYNNSNGQSWDAKDCLLRQNDPNEAKLMSHNSRMATLARSRCDQGPICCRDGGRRRDSC
jgi:hypothetical protein